VFEYGDSEDDTLEILKKIKNENVIKTDVFKEPIDQGLKMGGAQAAAVVYNDWKSAMLDNEDYFMLIDSDLVGLPKNLIKKLLEVDADIAAPYPWSEGKRHFYDNWIFRIENLRFSPQKPPGMGLKYPVEVDSVGTCFLAKREPWLTVPIFNPYPNLTFCNSAKRFGYDVVALPYVEVIHKDIEKLGIIHNPLHPNMGGYPRSQEFIDVTFPILRYNKKKPEERKANMEIELAKVEQQIMNKSIERYETDPIHKMKGKKWSHNKTHFDTFWCTRNPWLLHLMYKAEMYPSYIEIEISNKCPYSCLHCEHPYWNQEERNMTWEEFTMIMDQFPNLKWMAFTGIGDPWVNPIFMDAVKYVKDRDVYIEMYDTFQHFTEDSCRKFVEWGVERLFVSLDAATKETYEKVRKGHKWDRMIKNVKLLDKIKKEHNSPYPEINFHFVIDKNNIHEAVDCVDFVKSLNINNGFIQYSRLLHSFSEIEDIYIDIPSDLQTKIIQKGNELGVPVAWNADIPKKLPPLHMCTALWMPFFFATGEVIVCCAQHEQNNRALEKNMSMGNIFETKDFKKIWHGPRYTQVRNLLYQDRLPGACVDCPIQDWKNHKVHKMV